jgi:chemotaxis protein MotB
MKRMILVVVTALAVGAVTACVSQEEYESALEQIRELEKELAEVRKMRSADQERIEELTAENTAMLAKLEQLGVKLTDLSGALSGAKADIEAKQKIIEEMKKKELQAKKRLETLKDMLAKFRSLIEGGKLKVKIKNGKMMLELPSAILFESGKADLSEEGKQTLGEVASVLATIPDREFQVAGHTDDVPITSKKFPSNWELSTARAVAVVKHLQEMGVDPRNLSAAGYSEYQPTASNQTEQGRALNRRIEITLMPNLEELPDLSDLEEELD